MAEELHEQMSDETKEENVRDLSHLEQSAILMRGRFRALAERTIAAKSPPQEMGGTALPEIQAVTLP